MKFKKIITLYLLFILLGATIFFNLPISTSLALTPIDAAKFFSSAAGIDTTKEGSTGILIQFVAYIITILITIIGIIFVILVIAGGFLWMTAQGNEEQVKKAKEIIISASIGLAVIVFAGMISYWIALMVEINPAGAPK